MSCLHSFRVYGATSSGICNEWLRVTDHDRYGGIGLLARAPWWILTVPSRIRYGEAKNTALKLFDVFTPHLINYGNEGSQRLLSHFDWRKAALLFMFFSAALTY